MQWRFQGGSKDHLTRGVSSSGSLGVHTPDEPNQEAYAQTLSMPKLKFKIVCNCPDEIHPGYASAYTLHICSRVDGKEEEKIYLS